MPSPNRFGQPHASARPARMRAEAVSIRSAEFRRRMEAVGARYRAAGVRAVYLAHDAAFSGPAAEPAACDESFAWAFETAINAPGARRLPVRLFDWSGEANHIGRADGAVRLLGELATLEPEPAGRVLLWGRGDAANVFALAARLLGGSRRAVADFFAAARIYYRWPFVGCVDIAVWNRVRRLLAWRREALADVALDIATFAAPHRYGWTPGGYRHLLHFTDREPVAQSDVSPGACAWRARRANRRLARLLLDSAASAEVHSPQFPAADQGATLLIDYHRAPDLSGERTADAGLDWLVFHAEQVARWFYSGASAVRAA